MARLLFKQDAKVNGEIVFKAGQVYEISNDKGSVDRWIKRGAVLVQEEVKKVEVAEVVTEVEVVEQEAIANPEAKVNNKGRKSKLAKA